MVWTISDARIGYQGIAETEPATLNGTQPALGTIMNGTDDVYNGGEFIFLRGVASTVPGDVVTYNTFTGTTTRSVAATRGPLAVAMSSNVANQFGWYQIGGVAIVNGAAGITAGQLLYLTATAGQLSSTSVAAQKVENAISVSAVGTPAAGRVLVQLNNPAANGNS